MVIPNSLSIKASIEQEITDLISKGQAGRSVSRIWLTDKGKAQAAWLKLEQALYGSLIPIASSIFPRRA